MRIKSINLNYFLGKGFGIGLAVLTFSVPMIYAQSATGNGTSLGSENDLIITGNPKTQIQQQLWEARIGELKETKENTFKDELEAIIQEISTIELKPELGSKPKSESSLSANVFNRGIFGNG